MLLVLVFVNVILESEGWVGPIPGSQSNGEKKKARVSINNHIIIIPDINSLSLYSTSNSSFKIASLKWTKKARENLI